MVLGAVLVSEVNLVIAMIAVIYPVQRFVASNNHSFLGPLGLPTDERYAVEWMDIIEKQSSYMNSLVERLGQFGPLGLCGVCELFATR